MNRGDVPGFYFDAEKNKYFRIQANHVAPRGAKYSKGNVKVEQREAKKRKTEHKKNAKVRQQRVVKAPVLANPTVGGAGLLREQRSDSSALDATSRDAVLINALTPRRCVFRHTGFGSTRMRVTQAQYVPELNQVALATTWNKDGDWDGEYHTLECVAPWPILPGSPHDSANVSGGSTTHPFRGPVHDFSVCTTSHEVPVVAACFQRKLAPSGFYVGILDGRGSTDSLVPAVQMTFKDHSMTLWRCSWAPFVNGQPDLPRLAVAGTASVWVVRPEFPTRFSEMLHRTDFGESQEISALDWLDADTLAYGVDKIQLWDLRSGGRISRFDSPGKARLTGLLTPPNQGTSSNTIFASTNHAIHLYDRRYMKTSLPVVSFRHIHQGMQLQFTSITRDLIAAADRDNRVSVYSLRTGSTIGQLARPEGLSASDMITSLRWCDDDRLMACQGGDVVEWRWSSQDEVV